MRAAASPSTRDYSTRRWAARTTNNTARSCWPIEGREVVAAIFTHPSATRGSATYTTDFKLDEHTTFLRWVGTMDRHKFESLEVGGLRDSS